jgi:hypothetical protein
MGLTWYDYQICGTVNTGWRQGINTVIGGGSCSNTASPTVGNVVYAASHSVTLKSGFIATASGTRSFTAYLEPCSYTIWKDDVAVADDPQGAAGGGIQRVISADEFAMSVYPNPFSDGTTVEIVIPDAGPLKLVLYDMLGKEVMTLMDSYYAGGLFKMDIDGNRLERGMYMLAAFSSDKKMIKQIVRN